MEFIKDILRSAAIFVGQNLFFLIAQDRTEVTSTGPFLVVAPHPDDETLGCGAFIARARRAGQRVRIVIALSGAVDAGDPSREIAEVRRKEARSAASALGVASSEIVFLDYPDGAGANCIDEIEARLHAEVDAVRPALILSPYGADEHADHRAVAQAVERLCRKAVIRCPVYEYPVWFWIRNARNHLMRVERLRRLRRIDSRAHLAMKKEAMKAHHSQNPRLFGGLSEALFQPFSFHAQFFAHFEIFFEKAPSSQ